MVLLLGSSYANQGGQGTLNIHHCFVCHAHEYDTSKSLCSGSPTLFCRGWVGGCAPMLGGIVVLLLVVVPRRWIGIADGPIPYLTHAHIPIHPPNKHGVRARRVPSRGTDVFANYHSARVYKQMLQLD